MASGSQSRPDTPLIRLIFIYSILAVGILVAGYLVYKNYAKQLRKDAEIKLSAVAELKTQELIRWREERFADSAEFSNNPAFVSLFRRYLVQPNDADTRQQLTGWLSKLTDKFHYNQIRLMNARGETILSIPGQIRQAPISEQNLFAEIMHKGEPVLSDFFRSDSDQRIYLAMRIPIKDDGTTLGLLSLRIDPEKNLYPFILRWPTPSTTAETLLIRRDGNHILYLNELRFRKGSALNLRIPLTRTDVPAVQAALGETGIREGIDYRDAPVIADVRGIPNSPWYLTTRMDVAEVYAPARERLWLIWGTMSALLAATGMALFVAWREKQTANYRERAKVAQALEAALEEAKFERAKTLAILENIGDGISIQNPELRVLYQNATHRKQMGEHLGEYCYQAYQQRAEICPGCHLVQSFADSQVHVRETTASPGGEPRYYQILSAPLFDSSGKIIAGIESVRDITERKQAEKYLQQKTTELEQANQELEAFSYTLSHDLRSYLTRIQLAGESLQEFAGESFSEHGKTFLQMILGTCQSMDDLIATMLTLAHISRQELHIQEIDLSALAEEICDELAKAEPDRTFHFDIAPDIHAAGDYHLLRVVLENLFGNACKYSKGKEKPCISLRARHEEDGRLVVAIADNGVGFDMTEAGRLFQPFQRLSSARNISGFGIGLTTTYRIIQRHGGEIWAEAVPGEGATFFFTLPHQKHP